MNPPIRPMREYYRDLYKYGAIVTALLLLVILSPAVPDPVVLGLSCIMVACWTLMFFVVTRIEKYRKVLVEMGHKEYDV